MSNPIVSVLIPTNNRIGSLQSSLESLSENIEQRARVEILVRADNDDQQTIKFLEANPKLWSLMIHGDVTGYENLHLIYDELFRMARGQFMFIWQDDALMQTKGWDAKVMEHASMDLYPLYLDPRAVVNDARYNFIFPIVHRAYWHVLNRFSAVPHVNRYVYEVMRTFFPGAYRSIDIDVVQRSLIGNHVRRPWDGAVEKEILVDREKMSKYLETL